ncbi:MAG TPA: DUF1385 domain-containing protein [Solirubrobacteraceae bacterium]
MRTGGDQPLTAVRDAPVGGQAVLEGVMMRGVRNWAVAVREPLPEADTSADAGAARPAGAGGAGVDPVLGNIAVRSFPLGPPGRRRRLLRLPVIRGVAALVESLGIGMRALSISASAQLPGEDEEISGGAWVGTVLVSVVFAVGLFFVVPVGLTSLIKDQLGSSVVFWLVEGVLRTSIFLGYLLLLSRVPDLRRVFQYHGAEHKVISAYEAEDELTPERAALYSRLHPRCGTSFLLIVMIMAIFVFAPVGLPAWWILVLTRILGVPLIAGLSFEVIKWAGRNRARRWVQWIMYPGLQLQRLTTREPDLDQLAVSIAALEAVLALETPGENTAEDLLGVEVVA